MSNKLKQRKSAVHLDPNTGKELKCSAFTAKILQNGYVCIKAVGGFSITYPAVSVLTGHLYQFIVEGNVDAVQMLSTLHYSCSMIVPDEEFYKGILKLIDEYSERNKKPSLDDSLDEKEVDAVKEMVDIIESSMNSIKNGEEEQRNNGD